MPEWYYSILHRVEKQNQLIGSKDPYTLSENEFSVDFDIPSLLYTDIVNDLVFRRRPYSADDMKAYKSVETSNLKT